MSINVEDFLSENEMKEIAAQAWKQVCFSHFETNKERILSNTAYECVYNMVDEVFGDNLNKLLSDKIVALIGDMTLFNVFRQKDLWDREESVATKLLHKVVVENEPLLQSVVKEQMENVKIDEGCVNEAIYNVIVNKLTTKN